MQTKVVFFVVLFAAISVHAFPEMIEHGYVHCTTCHESPTGGGLLTAYGRSLSKEVLSRWSYDGEEQILHGAFNGTAVAKYLNSDEDTGFFAGGDFREIQTQQNNDNETRRMGFLMQADLEAAYRLSWGSFDVTYGQQKGATEQHPERDPLNPFILRRWNFVTHAVGNIWTRVGLGTPHFGIVTSEHIWSIENGLGNPALGFGPFDRRNLVEVENQGEHWGGLLGYAESDDTIDVNSREKSEYGFLDGIIGISKKLGIDLWHGTYPSQTRNMFGGHALLGWDEHWVTLAQYTAMQTKPSTGSDVWGWYFFQKTTWEFTKGCWASFVSDFSQADQSLPLDQNFKYGVGFQFFPRPHFEVQMDYLRVKDRSISDNEGDMAFAILHYYL